jgi:TraM recognition site of TraD and TraG
MDEFAPIAYSNFANILQTARGSNTAFLFAMQSIPQLLSVGKAFQHDVASAPNTTFMLRTRDEDTAQYFLNASARVRQLRRSMSIRKKGIFNPTYEDQGVGSQTEIKETRSEEEHIKNLPVGQMEFYDAPSDITSQLSYLKSLKKLTESELTRLSRGMTIPDEFLRKPTSVELPPRSFDPNRKQFSILDHVRKPRRKASGNY